MKDKKSLHKQQNINKHTHTISFIDISYYTPLTS